MRHGSDNNLVFNVSGLLQEQVGATRAYDLVEPEIRLDDGLTACNVTGEIQLLRTGRGILARGKANADVELECSRCLAPIHRRITANIEELFRPTVGVTSGERVPLTLEGEHEEDFFEISPEHILDLTEAIRQNLLVNVPLSPLCKEDCAGLCPECGADLNVEDCGHTRRRADDRLASLASLLDELEE